MYGSSACAVRFFFVARGAEADPEPCLPLSDVREVDLAGDARFRGGDGAVGRWARGGSVSSSDSGTSRNSMGWLLGPTPALAAR